MFNKHFHSHDDRTIINFPDTIEVHEHKAPTDESVKLLREMEDKALKSIIGRIRVEDNTLNGVAIAYQDLSMIKAKHGVFIHLKFSINKVEYTFEEEVNDFGLDTKNQQAVEAMLRDRLKVKVVNTLFTHLKAKVLDAIGEKQFNMEKQLGHNI